MKRYAASLFVFACLCLLSQTPLFAQQETEAEGESKLKFADKIGHWLVAYGISNPEYMDTLKNDFKSRAFAQVYIEGIIDHDAWMFNLLNRITKFRYQEKQTPNIVFEVKFQPENKEVMDSYKLVLSVRTNGNERNDLTRVLDEAVAEHISNTRYPDPEKALADIESTIHTALDGIAEKLGTDLAPDLMVRYQNEIFWDGHEIPIMEEEGNFVEIEAVNKNGDLLSASEVIWTNADPFESKGVVDLTGVGSREVTLMKRSDSTRLTVLVKRFNATEDINELLKEILVEALSSKKQEALDSIETLKQDSIENARSIASQLALFENGNYPLEANGVMLSPLLTTPKLLSHEDSLVFNQSEDRKQGFRLLRRHKALASTIRKKINVVAFANLVVDQPEKMSDLLDALLANSGRLLARLVMNRDSQGQREQVRNIVVDFLNQNLERIAGSSFGFQQPIPRALPVPPPRTSPTSQMLSQANRFYINPAIDFAGKEQFIEELATHLQSDPNLYVVINYSQDISNESFALRATGGRPLGVPEGARFIVITYVNIPGSIFEGYYVNGEVSASPEEIANAGTADGFRKIIGSEGAGGTFVTTEIAFEFTGSPSPEPTPEKCLIFIDPNHQAVLLPDEKVKVIYTSGLFPKGTISGFELEVDGQRQRYSSYVDRSGNFLKFIHDRNVSQPYVEANFCAADISGAQEVHIASLDEVNCTLIYSKGDFVFPAGNRGVSPALVSNLKAISSKIIETGDCDIEDRPLIEEIWSPTQLDLTKVNSEEFQLLMQETARELGGKLEAAIGAYPTDATGLYGDAFFHIVNHELLPLVTKAIDYQFLEHKLQFLKEETGIQFFVILDEVNFYFDPYSDRRNEFAKQVFDNTPSLKNNPRAVLVTIPYADLQKNIVGATGQYVMPGIYYPQGLVDANFKRNATYPSIIKMLESAYTWLPKPYRTYLAFLNVDGTITYSEQPPIAEVRGKPTINFVGFYKNKGFDVIKNLPLPRPRQPSSDIHLEPAARYEIDLYKYSAEVAAILEQYTANPVWEPVQTKMFKERAIPQYYRSYARKLAFVNNGLEEWWNEMEINFASGNDDTDLHQDLDEVACYGFSKLVVLDPVIYTVIDIVGLIPVVDNFADAAGLCYATARLDHENMVNYTIGIAAVGVGTLVVKFGGRAVKVLYKGSVWLIEHGKAAVRLTRLGALSGPASRLLGIADEAAFLGEDLLLGRLDEMISSGTFSHSILNDILFQATDAAKVARLRKAVEVEDMVKLLPERQASLLRTQLDQIQGMTTWFLDNPGFVAVWKKLDDLGETALSTDRNALKSAKSLFDKNPDLVTTELVSAGKKLNDYDLLKLVPDLNDADAAVLHYYTVGSLTLNRKLNQGSMLTAFESEWRDQIKNSLAKLRATKKYTGRVIRGQSLPEDVIRSKYVVPFEKAKATGGPALVEEKAFLSTSTDSQVADDFINKSRSWPGSGDNPVLFRIDSKNGVDIDDISDYGKNLCSTNPKCSRPQQEVLLDGGGFRINDVRVTNQNGINFYEIFLAEL